MHNCQNWEATEMSFSRQMEFESSAAPHPLVNPDKGEVRHLVTSPTNPIYSTLEDLLSNKDVRFLPTHSNLLPLMLRSKATGIMLGFALKEGSLSGEKTDFTQGTCPISFLVVT
ncbi:uncharacterized protein LOC144291774 [Canis aureus]